MKKNEYKAFFAAQFRKAVEESNKQFTDVANYLDKARSTVSCWADPNNPNNPPLHLMNDIANYLKKPVSYFFHDDDPVKVQLSYLEDFIKKTVVDDSHLDPQLIEIKQMLDDDPELSKRLLNIYKISKQSGLVDREKTEQTIREIKAIPSFCTETAILELFHTRE